MSFSDPKQSDDMEKYRFYKNANREVSVFLPFTPVSVCRMPGSCRVFLGNLPSDCRVEDIEDFFR
jgi:hypothetical protein